MRNRSLFALALTLAIAIAPADAATLPKLEATSLGGTHVVLPAAQIGKPFVLVVGYARESQASLQAWAHALAKALPDTPLYATAVVVGAPGFVHGFISQAIRKSAPASVPQHDAQVLLTFDGTGWTGIAPAGTGADAAVFVIGPDAAIVDAIRTPLADDALKAVVAVAKAIGAR